ncbi:hypothetical protein [Cyanobium sp. CH-040]|uniref:hypothetical protein n=1 Tax=Cyanobium sp. CH-040 TaxID=2823708 RepID=UPI0020CD26CF|nr:hypothetical protein [Cyanobium sp. CH-040]MCP9927089.1 hypothetical protein [Cyanobium sp. CH-040]
MLSRGSHVVTGLAAAFLGLAMPIGLGFAAPGLLGRVQAQQQATPLTARAVQFRASAPLPGTIPFEKKPLGHDTGFEIVYLVQGRDLTGVKEGSLQLTSLRGRDGSDLSLTRTGNSPVQLGPFPEATDDGLHLLFSVQSGEDLFGRVDERSLRGSVVVFTGSRRESGELSLTPASPPQALGPFQVQPAAGAAPAAMGVTVTGPLPALINALQIRDGRAVTAEQTSWDGTQKTFHFPTGGGASQRIRLNYWTDLQERTVTFGP